MSKLHSRMRKINRRSARRRAMKNWCFEREEEKKEKRNKSSDEKKEVASVRVG